MDISYLDVHMVVVLVGQRIMIGVIRFSKGLTTPSPKDKPVLEIEKKDDPRTCALMGNTQADGVNGCILPFLQIFKKKKKDDLAISKSSHGRSVGWMKRNVRRICFKFLLIYF